MRLCLAVAAIVAAASAAAQLVDTQPRSLVGPRSLALSPDGSRLAFVYRGDVWVGPSAGGRAVAVTNHVEMDDRPVWSPDGKWIAFTSNRTGNGDVFAVPADGGETSRLTWFSGNDVPSDWSPDGRKILFSGSRDASENGVWELDVKTLAFRPLFLDNVSVSNPRYLSDGKVAYNRRGFPWFRARYQGSAASQVWTFDPATGAQASWRDNGFQHLWVTPGPDGKAYAVTVGEKTPSSPWLGKPTVRYTDDAAKTPNVYEIDSRGRARRLTNFVGGGVRFLTASADGQTLAFEYEGRAYTMAPPGGEPKAVEFTAAMDDKFTNEERLVLTSGADEMALLPKGETVVFSVRSELWSVPVKKEKGPNADDARQLTAWAGLDEQPLAAPDGKTLFFVSDRDGARNLYKMDIESKKTTRITTGDRDVFRLSLTPDRKRLSFFLTGPQGGLYAMDLEGAPNPQLVFAEPGEGSVAYSWSPDGRWVAYADQLDRSGYYFWESGTNVWVYDTVEKRSYNVTKENSTNVQPSWSADGRYLYFRTFRASGGANVGALWVIPLQREDRRSDELQLKYEKPAAPVKVEIDFDRIEDRARRFIGQDPQSAVQSNPETGDLYFLSEGDLWRASYSGEDLRRLTAGGGIGDFSFNEDYKSVWFVKGGVPSVMDITKPNFPVTSVTFRADWVRDLRLERKAAFDQFWREYNRSFYDGNFHGRDWVATKRRYEPLLDSVGHRNEMATVLNMMVGELESSHSEVSSAPGNPGGSSSAHPGFSFDYTHTGPGLKVREVPQGAPGSYAATAVKPGEYVLEINGRPVRADEALFRDVLNDQSGREITLLVNDKPNAQGARAVKYRAVSGGEFGGLKRRNLLEARRAYVEEKSGGWLTYVHISGMGGGNFDQFQREFWQATEGKQGVIIDVRDNGGGNISDRLIDIIERRPHSYYVPRDEKPLLAPGQTWGLATVVMHAESSFSNAEMFPYAMKQRGLAATVGMPTPGYVIWTGGFRLVDGTGARMPGSGVYRMDGSPLENMGQVPDHQVQQSATDYFAGRDPQLDKAIEVALKAAK